MVRADARYNKRGSSGVTRHPRAGAEVGSDRSGLREREGLGNWIGDADPCGTEDAGWIPN